MRTYVSMYVRTGKCGIKQRDCATDCSAYVQDYFLPEMRTDVPLILVFHFLPKMGVGRRSNATLLVMNTYCISIRNFISFMRR